MYANNFLWCFFFFLNFVYKDLLGTDVFGSLLSLHPCHTSLGRLVPDRKSWWAVWLTGYNIRSFLTFFFFFLPPSLPPSLFLFGQGCPPLFRLLGPSFALKRLHWCVSKWWKEDESCFQKHIVHLDVVLPQHWYCRAAPFIILRNYTWPWSFYYSRALVPFSSR